VAEIRHLRVTIRRFYQVLDVFAPFFAAGESKRIHRTLKKMMNRAGEIRDLDIAADWLHKSRLAGATALRAKLERRRREAGRTLSEKLQHWTKRRIFSKWRRHLLPSAASADDGASRTVESLANDILPGLVDRLFALGSRAARTVAHDRAQQLHQLRIATKKTRYTLEFFAPLRESAIRSRVEQLKTLQNFLGEINDLEIVRAIVVKEDEKSGLEAALAKRRDQQIEEFASHWATELAGPANEAAWKKDLTGFSEKRNALRRRPARPESAAPSPGDARLQAS
jgi:CHAD domain-containing protein